MLCAPTRCTKRFDPSEIDENKHTAAQAQTKRGAFERVKERERKNIGERIANAIFI